MSAASSSSTTTAQSLSERVGQALQDFLARQAEQLAAIDDELLRLVEAVVALVSAGKRIRPAFCYWGWRGAGAPDRPEIDRAAAALELLQASALIHDDVIDASDLRRGQPATHRRLADLHLSRGWSGSTEKFGVGGAILVGDLCLAWSDEMLRSCGLASEQLVPALPYFDLMRTELMAGQYLDLASQAAGTASLPQAMRVVRYKAAKYTVERPLQLGGALAGAPPSLLQAYSSYGLPIGEAFQLRDDILGVFGDPQVTGKPAGDDLREGKRTVLVAKTLERANPAQAARFRDQFGAPHLDARGVDELREIIVATGALAGTERLITELTEAARVRLAQLPLVDSEARSALEELAQAATQRVV